MEMDMRKFTSEIQLRKSFKCDTFKTNKQQSLIVHYQDEKICIPYLCNLDELVFKKAEKITEDQYLNMKYENEKNIKKNNYYFSK